MSEPRQRWFRPRTDRARALLVLGPAAAVTVFTATVPLLRDWFDLRVYHGAIDTWVHHDGRIYDYLVPGTTYGFTYPPFAAVAMLPMALVGLRTAIVLCLALDLVALAAVLYVLGVLSCAATAGSASRSPSVCSRCSSRCGTPSVSAR